MYSQSKRRSILAATNDLEKEESPDYGLPTVSRDHLRAFLDDIGIEVTEEDLRRPNRSRTRQLFLLLIHHFRPWRLQAMSIEKRQIMSDYNLSESDLDMLETQVIFLETKRFLKTLRCTDVSLSDFTEPTADRLQMLLTTIMNFSAYLQEKAGPKSDPLALTAGQIAQDVHDLSLKKEELVEIRDAMKEKKESEQDETDRIQLDIKLFEQELINLRRECETRMQELDLAKKERLAVKDKLQSLQMEVLNAIDIRKGLQEKEDCDIEALQEHASQLEEEIEQFTHEINNNREISPQADDQVEQLKLLDTNLARAIKTINSWSSRRKDMKRQKRTCEAVQREIQGLSSENRDLAAKSTALKRFAAAEELKIERLNEDQAKKRESMKHFWEFREKGDDKLRRDEAATLKDRLEFEKKRDSLAQKISHIEQSDKAFEESIMTLLRQVTFKVKERII